LPERLGHYIVLPHAGNHHRPEIVACINWLVDQARLG
jgi:LysR family glycine cleavage system transcriptional activator